MKYTLLIFVFLFRLNAFSQNKNVMEVTPPIQEKILRDIDKETTKLKQQLEKSDEHPVYSEFTIDTFRIQRFMEKWITLDNSDYGMQNAGYATAKLYDSLLNKYYKKLLAVLKGDDKKILMQAQKAWLLYRDSETKLVEIIGKEEYAGGGTMQNLTEASEYLNLIKSRTIIIFEHYVRATQSY